MSTKLYDINFEDRPFLEENKFITAIPHKTMQELKKEKVALDTTIDVSDGENECKAKVVRYSDGKLYFHCYLGTITPIPTTVPALDPKKASEYISDMLPDGNPS